MEWSSHLLQLFGVLTLCLYVNADVTLETCEELDEPYTVNVANLSFSPYPIVLSSILPGKTFDVSFAIDVKEEIPEDATIEVMVERVGFYGNIQLPCIHSVQDIIDGLGNFTLPPLKTTSTTPNPTTEPKMADATESSTIFPNIDLDCHYNISEVFAWHDGGLCTALGGDCSEILKPGLNEATVKMPVPLWLWAADANGGLDPYIAGTYVLNIKLIDPNGKVLGCSSVEFEISDPKAPATTTQEPDPEHNVVLDSCTNSSESSVDVDSVLISPYPIILHSFMSYDVMFSLNVTSPIPDDALISVAVEGILDDKVVPLPCFTDLEAYENLNDTCDFSLTQVFEWDDGALCDLFDTGCTELQEVGEHSGKVKMDVPLILGSVIFAGNLDAFIAGTYKLDISLLDQEEEILGCASITFDFYTPTTTAKTTTTETEPGNDAPLQKINVFFVLVSLLTSFQFFSL